ncbi:MAG: hypothetical protein ACKVTZ_01345 [Bacteroidia bacterium]
MKKCIFVSLLLLQVISLQAQRGWGMRFSSSFYYFNRSKDDFSELIDGWFSTGMIGPYYKAVSKNGGYEVGLNIAYKGNTAKGSANLPLIMQDFNKNSLQEQNVGVTALETYFRVGPRFGYFIPKTGYVLGYYFKNAGFQDATYVGNKVEYNKFYLLLPIGTSFDFPTNWGTVGFGAYYMIGLINVMKKPEGWGQQPNPGGEPVVTAIAYDGSKLRGLNFEITVSMNTKNQRFKEEEALRKKQEEEEKLRLEEALEEEKKEE